MSKRLTVFVAGLVFAFIAAAFGSPGAYQYYCFKTRDYMREREALQIRETVKFFSATIAGFYATGGATSAGLNMFPADRMIKRRIFQDINNWMGEGKLLVMDRDRSVVKEVKFIGPDRAVALVDENWFNVYQDRKTRRQISAKKANFITVRYFLKKMWGRWIVIEYYVYKQGEPLPLLPLERLALW